MTPFLRLYNEITFKVSQGIVLIKELREENNSLNERVLAQEVEIEELRKKVDELETKNKIITTSKTLLLKNDKKENIKKIDDFVREIDNCIKLINSIEWQKKKER